MAFIALLPELAEAGAAAGEAGAAAGGAAEAGAGAAEAGAGAAEAGAGAAESTGGLGGAARSVQSGIGGMVRDFNDSQVGKFLGSSQGRMVTQGMQLGHQFNTNAQQQEQRQQQQEQGPQFGG